MYMDSKDYVRLENEEVRAIIERAHKEVATLALRYISMINNLLSDNAINPQVLRAPLKTMRIFQNSMLSDSRLSLTGRSATEAFGVWLGTQRECFADDSSHPGRRYLADFERGSADHRPESGYRLVCRL